jgi:hypothetical protein
MGWDLTGLGSLFDFGGKLIDRLIPDPAAKLQAQQELMKMTMDQSLAQMANDTALVKMQTDINLEEAKNPSVFVSGARPGLMWVGIAGVAYQWLVAPLGTFIYTISTGHGLPAPLPVMPGDMIMLLGGLMGLHIGSRTVEKINGVAAV